MKKIILINLIFFTICISASSQKFMYDDKGNKEYFIQDSKIGIIIFKDAKKVSLSEELYEKNTLQKGGLKKIPV